MNKLLTKLITRDAYLMAARAMCSRCAEGVPVIVLTFLNGESRLIHKLNSPVGMVEETCQAAPIHELIDRLNEVK